MDLWIQGTPWATEPLVWGSLSPCFVSQPPLRLFHCGGLWGWMSGRAEIHLGLQCRFVPKDVIGIRWLDLGLYGKVWGAFQSHGIALFRGNFFSFTPCLMTVTKQSRGALLLPLGSLGVCQVPRSVLCSQSEVFHVLENGLGKGKSISTALVCVTDSIWPTGSTLGHRCAASQALFIPVPHVLVPVQGWKVEHSTGLCLRVSPIAASSPPAPHQHPLGWCQGCQSASSLESRFLDLFVCLGFSLCYQTPPKRHFLQSHLDLCNIPCYISHGCTPVVLGEFSPLHACCAHSFPCACCHTACEQDTAAWSPCGSFTPGMGGWSGSCTLNKRSLKATRYLHLPWGWELMETQLWKCSGFPASSSVEHRESWSEPSDQVMVPG